MAVLGRPLSSEKGGIYLEEAPVLELDQNITELENEPVQETRRRMFSLGVEGTQVPGRCD